MRVNNHIVPSQTAESKDYKPRTRRTKSFWEPIFDPLETDNFPSCNWDFQHNGGPKHMTLCAEQLDGSSTKFDKITFENCDFSGEFDFSPREIVFKNCIFDRCDFGLSTWIGAKFRDCSFVLSSFTQTKWRACEFRSCKWDRIGISGNETEFLNTLITNPEEFISSAYTNTDYKALSSAKTTKFYQRMRLEVTKSTVARGLSRDYQAFGDEKTFYNSVKVSTIQSIKAKIFECLFEATQGKSLSQRALGFVGLPMAASEWLILQLIGFVNAWGASVARPSLIGALIVLSFASLYYWLGMPSDYGGALIKSIEVTLLIGYTNHSSGAISACNHYLVLLNMIVGLLWYVVIIPTLVNRVSRVR